MASKRAPDKCLLRGGNKKAGKTTFTVGESIITPIRNYFQALKEHGLLVSFGVIFGSWAKGKQDKWSDIDLLIVSPDFDANYSRKEINLLWQLAAKVDSRIEPIPCGEKQWQDDDSRAIVEIAKREGVVVNWTGII